MDLLSLFADTDDAVELPEGSVVFRQGDPGDRMYVVLDGTIEVVADGITLRRIGRGEILGELALIDDAPRSADAVAATDVVLAPVDERRFLFLVHEQPSFALHVMGVMAQRLRH